MIFEEGKSFAFLHIKDLFCELIDRESHLLIFGIGKIVVGFEVIDFLMLYYLFHELDCRVILSAVLTFLSRNRDCLQLAGFLHQFYFHIGSFPRFQCS